MFRRGNQGVKKKKLDSRAIFFRYFGCCPFFFLFAAAELLELLLLLLVVVVAVVVVVVSDELHFFLCSFAPSSLPFLVFFHSAFQRNLLFFLSRSNPAEIETQISRTRTHPGGTENSGLEAHSLGPPEQPKLWVTNGTCRRPGREEPEHFHFSFPLCHPSLVVVVVDNFPVTLSLSLSRGAVPQKKNLFHRRGAPTTFRL